MQALARGFLARRAFACLRAQHEQQVQVQKARQAAALAVIAPWGPTFAARAHFLRLRWGSAFLAMLKIQLGFNALLIHEDIQPIMGYQCISLQT